MREPERLRVLLLFDPVHEIAPPAIQQFLRIRALDFSAAQGTGNCPARASRVFSTVRAVKLFVHRRRADPQFIRFMAAWLSPALFIFPAV